MKRALTILLSWLVMTAALSSCEFSAAQSQKNSQSYLATQKKNEVVKVFSADFSGDSPNESQFTSWNGREHNGMSYLPLHSIRCEDETAHLTAKYNKEKLLWETQMMSTAGLFEADHFTCEFQANFSGEPGSWQYVITYGTGTYWTNSVYSDGIQWPAGGEIDAFEQAGGYSESPAFFHTPSVHYGSGTASGYPDAHIAVTGDSVAFSTNEWHDFKFSLSDGIVTVWIDGEEVDKKDLSEYAVSNNYLCEYAPFLNPQAFYIGGQCSSHADVNTEFDFQIKNFAVYQQADVKCEKLQIYPQMWRKGTELVFPVGAEVYLARVYYPEKTSNKACTWKSSDEDVATVVQGLVHIVGEGTATISAACGEATAHYTIHAAQQADVPCAKVSMNDDTMKIKVGHEKQIEYNIYPAYTTDTVEFLPHNDQIAKFDGGFVYGQGVGNTSASIKCGSKKYDLNIIVAENTKEPVLSYDLQKACSLIGKAKDEDNRAVISEVANVGNGGQKYKLTAAYNETSTIINNEWRDVFSGVTLTADMEDNPIGIAKYPSLYLVKAVQCSIRTNNENDGNYMPSLDIDKDKIMIRYGDVNVYQADNSGQKEHCIAIYLSDMGAVVFIDGVKAADGDKTYIKNLEKIFIKTSSEDGIRSLSVYEDCEFTEDELENMTG